MTEKQPLLSIRGLSVTFSVDEGDVHAVSDVSYDIYEGKTLAVVGESGCGKSVTALSVLGLIPQPPGKITSGQVFFNGQELLEAAPAQMRKIRGNDIAMIFQEPMTSLNPVYTVGKQIVEAVELHQDIKGDDAWKHAADMLGQVGIADPEQRVRQYPHQMSGGMRQRVIIAMALSCNPELLIADEPSTALDVTIQAQILELLRNIQRQRNMSIMLITHDLGVVAENADDIVVMYASKIVETAATGPLFAEPLHPYTKGLLRSLPRLGEKKDRLETISGSVPDPLHFPDGCKFHPRCPVGCSDPRCKSIEPDMRQVAPGRHTACWFVENYQTEDEKKEYKEKYEKK